MTLREMRSKLNTIVRLCPELKECIIMIGLSPDIEQALCIILPEDISSTPEIKLKAVGVNVEREQNLLWLL